MLPLIAFGWGVLTSTVSGIFTFNITTYLLEEHERRVQLESANLRKQEKENRLKECRILQIQQNDLIRRQRNKEILYKLSKNNLNFDVKSKSLPIVRFRSRDDLTLIKSSNEMSSSYKEKLWWEENDFVKFQNDHLLSDEYYF